jgi:uncharacterized membrane protein
MPPYDSNTANSLIHLYRAEVGRMVMYRVRLDTTTNWAIVTTAGVTTFALGDPTIPHAVFLFAMVLVYFFLHIESRRFRVYEMSHYRTRLMERFFYHEMLNVDVGPDWHALLLADLAKPRSPVKRLDALGWRLRRNYLWIYGALILAWAVKLDFMGSKALTFLEVLSRAGVGPMPGWLTVLIVSSFYVLVFGLAVYASRDYRLEDD